MVFLAFLVIVSCAQFFFNLKSCRRKRINIYNVCFVSVHAVVGLELLATTLADKHMTTVLPNLVLVKYWQRLKSLATDITGSKHLSLSFALYFCAPPGPSSS